MCRLARHGFTLVEVLVLIGILTVLLGLTFGSVQRIRETSARAQCQNNLRQIGLGLHLYHDSHSEFPPGISVEDGKAQQPFLGWNARILPFLDQSILWTSIEQAFSIDSNFLDVPPHIHRWDIVPIFCCPCDWRVSAQGSINTSMPAFTSYVGVEGTDQYSQDGVLYLDSRIRFSDIRDGTSNTLMVAERPPSASEVLGWWYAGWGQARDGSAEMLLGASEDVVYDSRMCRDGPYPYGPGKVTNECDTYHYWSMHSGGANFLFCDGSTRFIPYSAASIIPALATRAGGEVFNTLD